MEPHLEFNTLNSGFNFKLEDWDHFSSMIVKDSMNLERDTEKCREKLKVGELTPSLVALITDCLGKSTEKVRVYGQSKRLWTDALKSKLKKLRKVKQQSKRYPSTETQAEANKCGQEFVTAMSKRKRKCWNNFLGSRNSGNIWGVRSFVKEVHPHTVVSQLTKKDGITTKELSEIVDCFFFFSIVVPSSFK